MTQPSVGCHGPDIYAQSRAQAKCATPISYATPIQDLEHVSQRLPSPDVLHSSVVSETEVLDYPAAIHYFHHKLDSLRPKVPPPCDDDLAARNNSRPMSFLKEDELVAHLRSKSGTELEDRDFRLSVIENSNYKGSIIWKIPQFSDHERKPGAQRKVESTLQTQRSSVDSMDTQIHTGIQHIVQKLMQEEMKQIQHSMAELRSRDDEITSLKATISKLEVAVRSNSTELKERIFQLSLIKNISCDGTMLWNFPDQKRDAEIGERISSLYSPPRSGYLTRVLGESTGKGDTHLSLFFMLMSGCGDIEFLYDKLRRQLLKERLREFLWRQKALRKEKSLECNVSAPLDVRWLEFQSLLLLAYGDVESNPGPLTRDELEKVTNSVLSEDDYFDVFTSVSTLCAKWHDFCLALGLPPSLLSSIRKDHTGDSKGCLREGLISWLQQSYKKEKYGLPSWRRLVQAVDHPDGGCNHALALKIAEEHKQPEVLQGSVSAPIPAAVCSDPKKSQAMSTAFANMYRAISRLLPRSVGADELEEFLRCFCHPQSPRQLSVDPRVYEGATSTKDILKKLCPEYINPAELFVLEGIVETFGSRQCKKLLRDFQDKFY